ncbi:LysR family transcriptional regulator [Actinomadura vinacea]|uniref:LysR family transcriptional regulator n=1 Tax=Actinomadura vinacea TaxID=115336 RepID=A0ABN3J511_9ACTN
MGRPLIETMDLVVFDAVARTGSFGRAAVDLQLAQPSISARVAALERKLGARLVTRGPRGTLLTPAGERLADYARRCLDLLLETQTAVGTQGIDRIVVAAPASLGPPVFPALLQALAGHPIDVVCRVAHSSEAIAAVLDGSAHAAFVLRRALPPGLEAMLVAASPIVAVAAPRHRLTANADLRPADLAGTPIVVHNWSEDAQDLANAFTSPRRDAGCPVRLVGTPDIAVDLALRLQYVAVIPLYAAVPALRAGWLRDLRLPGLHWEQQIRLIHRANDDRRPGIRRLRAAIPAILAEFTEH